ncbi:hypothetical protein TWF696_004504 [Orbilia brochopaga]|uniref:Uncharacterized protein n=1 Tax=Orbilia brochopaga TaxID=3140254 RepID=A0AAV9V7K2_9PEZI
MKFLSRAFAAILAALTLLSVCANAAAVLEERQRGGGWGGNQGIWAQGNYDGRGQISGWAGFNGGNQGWGGNWGNNGQWNLYYGWGNNWQQARARFNPGRDGRVSFNAWVDQRWINRNSQWYVRYDGRGRDHFQSPYYSFGRGGWGNGPREGSTKEETPATA